MKKEVVSIVGMFFGILFAFCPRCGTSGEQVGSPPGDEWRLPAPKRKGKVSLEEALNLRRSSKQGFSDKELSEQEIGQILWAARGVNRPEGKLTSPSAMARYSVSVYIALDKGTFVYVPERHSLALVDKTDIRRNLGSQTHMQTAPVILILIADYAKFPEDFSLDKKVSFSSAEAGAIGENVYLQCATMNLGTCLVASIDKEFIRKALALGENIEPLFAMPIGYPKL